ncbi:MAG: hypothetical protein AAFV80_15140 [Bacteroidota bacterium]
MKDYKPKSFWKRPEGVTGTIFLVGGIIAGLWLLQPVLQAALAGALTALQLGLTLLAIAAIVYVVLDPKARGLVAYGYRGVMRWITGLFVQLDPIGILQSYIEDLKSNLRKMNKQIGILRGQMHKLSEQIKNNQRQINSNLAMASKAKEKSKDAVMILKSRKAGRLKESNIRLEDLYKKMEVLYRVLTKMHENSEILLEDVVDQVEVKKQERAAIRASHSAMRSAMNIINGNNDRRQMFDMALEAIADDVSQKIGEMERFMDLSSSFMDSIDLQNGVFEEEGMRMLEKWEKEGVSLILGEDKQELLLQANNESEVLDLNAPVEKKVKEKSHSNQYNDLFNFD